MPNIITHTLFADDVMKVLDVQALNDHKQLVEIGSNGPDFLFFHNAAPHHAWKREKLGTIGSQLHKGHVREFYESALQSVIFEKNLEIKEEMMAYVCGHLCHWALDSTLHPYVFYRTGNCKGASSARHHRFESILDTIMLKIKEGKSISKFDIASRVTRMDMEKERAVARIYVPAIRFIFNKEVHPWQIHEALSDWNTLQNIFRDPSGSKIRFFQRLEKPLHLDNLLSGYMVPPNIEDNWDILNLKHDTWRHPITEEPNTDSVLDLYEKAMTRAIRAITLFLMAVEDPAERKLFLDYVQAINYDMGMDTDENMHCFDIVDLTI